MIVSNIANYKRIKISNPKEIRGGKLHIRKISSLENKIVIFTRLSQNWFSVGKRRERNNYT